MTMAASGGCNKKWPIMTEYAFPNDLLDGIKTRWQTVTDQQFALPEDHILRRLLETCYHASFRTCEQARSNASWATLPLRTFRTRLCCSPILPSF